MEYFVDCACENHDIWREFKEINEAEMYFNLLDCENKILYDTEFHTILSHQE